MTFSEEIEDEIKEFVSRTENIYYFPDSNYGVEYLNNNFSVLGTKFLKVLSMTQQESLSEFLNFTEKYLSKILLIKAFWLIDLSNKNFDIFSKKIYIDSLKTSKLMAIILPISNLLLQFCMLIVVMIAGIDVSKGIMSIADLTKFILLPQYKKKFKGSK